MKTLFLICVSVFSFNKIFAQTHDDVVGTMLNGKTNHEEKHVPIKEVIQHLSSDVYIYDTISSTKTVNDTLRLLYLGGKSPKNVLTIIIKGKKVNQGLHFLRDGNASHFSGKVILYEGKPAIVITNLLETGVQIQI